MCLGAGDFLPSACPPLGPDHLRAGVSRWGLMLMLQTPPNTTATKVLVNCSCLNCIPVFSVLCLCSAMLSCFLSVNKMLVLIHYCVMICSLKNIVHGGAVLSQGMCGNGLWWGGYQRSQNLRRKPGSWAELGIQAGAVGWPYSSWEAQVPGPSPPGHHTAPVLPLGAGGRWAGWCPLALGAGAGQHMIRLRGGARPG